MEARGIVEPLEPDSLRRLHRGSIESPLAIRQLLETVKAEGIELTSGVNHVSAPRTAKLVDLLDDSLVLATKHLTFSNQPQLYFAFALDGVKHFFAARPIAGGGKEPLLVAMPVAVYEAERRDLHRDRQKDVVGPERVRLWGRTGVHEAAVTDWSYQGLGLSLTADQARDLGASLELTYLDGPRRGQRSFASVKYMTAVNEPAGHVRVGLSVSDVESSGQVAIERRRSILPGPPTQQAWRRVALAGAVARSLPARVARRIAIQADQAEHIEVVEYPNGAGGFLKAIVNRTGEARGAPVVVIPPAWGKTKETLVALALTIVKTFERAGESVVVVRFDGTNRRGESYIEPEHRAPGEEYLGFTFSQAVRDIEATMDHFQSAKAFQATDFLLVSYSLGAVETRRAVAHDSQGRVKGWVSVVGMVDLQSGLRTVSGGVDYAYGLSRNVRFGRHELVGVVADMDRTGLDAIQHGLVFAEDARRDMAAIDVPVTWIHGRYDAWMELWRVRNLLSAGPTEGRRLIEVSAGHHMRTSREALETFQLVAQEVARMISGAVLELPRLDVAGLQRTSAAERRRIRKPGVDLRSFWRDYLLGRDRRLGIELMTSTTAYRELMQLQVERLALADGDVVVDLGAGTGSFPTLVGASKSDPENLHVVELDYVPEALHRGAQNARRVCAMRPGFRVSSIVADLDSACGAGLPLPDQSADAVIGSLVISYVSDPAKLLQRAHELLRPGGRLVLSTLKVDADISRIYVDGIAELPPDRVEGHFGEQARREFEVLQRRFLNDAARLIDLEEAGHFRFWDEEELAEVVRKAGFEGVVTERAFGDPAQALVVSARRR